MLWTNEQQKVIDLRNKNLLVSAAAGSGKTAVLVERIIKMITEGTNPPDIDRLLVVTFTNAAAAQMRDRIGRAIDKKLLNEPANEHLQKQLSLLHSAQITTIHSFCLNVIRNYFHIIDLDPSFKIAEEAEITLMKSDIVSEVLERWYEEGREDFHSFIESYSHSKSDEPVEEMVLKLYEFAMSAPWPKEWLQEINKSFELTDMKDMVNSPWMIELLRQVDTLICDMLKINEETIKLCNEASGPKAYLAALLSDRELLTSIRGSITYEEYYTVLGNVTFARLSGKKEEGVSADIKEEVKCLREEVKKGIKDLIAQYFFQSPTEMLKDMQCVRIVMQVLIELTLDFMEAFSQGKEEKNLIDFNDIEHFALNILIEEKDGARVPSAAALELSDIFEEIMVDEYQDSNMVQETILRSISKEHRGRFNRFMVGDVKQSIYKFRLAMPEIFMEKFKRYTICDTDNSEEACELRIDLDRNFRSKKSVLDFVNSIFKQIMTEAVGDICYDEKVFLKYGGLYDEEAAPGDIKSNNVELVLVTEQEAALEDKAASDLAARNDAIPAYDNAREAYDEAKSVSETQYPSNSDVDEEEIDYTKKELEARAIAKRIKELTDPESGMLLFDKDKKAHYRATYKDVVILLRSMTGWSDILVNMLMQEGIPAYADTGTGYFKTLEIMTLLNMFKIIDNPLQDIPFTGVLYSPIVGLTSDELAKIRLIRKKGSMYEAARQYITEGTYKELKVKLNNFIAMLEDFRFMIKHVPINELIFNILNRTGYYYYVLAMPGGDRRKANIDMLVNLAVRFEKGSYSGLFHFIRYIERLQKYNVDYGEAITIGEQDNTVRIMSIHKSKGLEFPIVIVAALSKQFNTQDIRNSIVLHSQYGIGPEYIDINNRTKVPTLLKKVIQKKIRIENMGEELRVLYVAMTRAKEKLIMTGYINAGEKIARGDFSFYNIISAKSFMDLVLPAIGNSYEIEDLWNNKEQVIEREGVTVTIVDKSQLTEGEVNKQLFLTLDEHELMSIKADTVYDATLREEISSQFNYVYPFAEEANIRVKLSVSELKKAGQQIEEEDGVTLYPPAIEDNYSEDIHASERPATIPDFIRGKDNIISGTDRGTLYHRILELIDLAHIHNREDLISQLDKLVTATKLMPEDVKRINLDYISSFIASSLAERMRNANIKGRLYKEKQFVMGIRADEVYKNMKSDELLLIQGIIDAFFEEEGELVIVDYKSDVVKEEQALIKRYRVQLEYYKRALEQITQKRVKEMIIYSLYLSKEICI